jgi:hypothetical protein
LTCLWATLTDERLTEMNRIEQYVEKSFTDIPDSPRKEQLKQEILLNLREKVYHLVESGKSEEDAENKAIVDFGDINDIRQELWDVGGDFEQLKPTGKSCWYQLWFSIWGSALIIALVLFINLYYSPAVIWFVYPTFGVLWWPLVMFFRWLKHR